MAQIIQWTAQCTMCNGPVEYHCNTCGDLLCAQCREMHLKSNAGKDHKVIQYSEHHNFISPSHEGHGFLETEARKTGVQAEPDKHSNILLKWEKSLQDVTASRKTYAEGVEQLDEEIVNRANQICKDVREVERETRKQLQDMKTASLETLEEQEISLTQGIQRIKDKLRTKEASQLEDAVPTAVKQLPPPAFIPGSTNVQTLAAVFGHLSGQSRQIIWIYRKISLLSKSLQSSIINPGSDYFERNVACANANQVWITTEGKNLHLVDKDGTVKETVKAGFRVGDMAVTSEKEILLSEKNNKSVKVMSTKGEIRTICNTKWAPHGICSLQNGDIMVAFRNDQRVIHYSSKGRVVKELDRSLFQYPWYVTYNQVNRHLYVCDKSRRDLPGSSGKILAFDEIGTLQYTYPRQETWRIKPAGLCTDQAGHVFITDFNNDRVHILDKDGHFLQYLIVQGGLAYPQSVDVDKEGYAWIGEHSTGEVKVVKYLEITDHQI